MTSPEARRKANVITIILGTLGTLFFIAMGLQVVPMKYAVFAGIACYLLAGAVRKVMVGER